jgi:nitrite reductase (NADH) large subunit
MIVATGATPNIGPAENTAIMKNIGLIVDDYMRTNYKQVYAAGDVAEVTDFLTGQKRILGLWTAAFEQGKIAGLNMAGKRTPYLGGIAMNSIDVLGLSVVTIGDTLLAEDSNGFSKAVYAKQQSNIYRKLFFKEEVLVGAILIGYSEDAGIIHNIIQSQIKIDRSEGGFGFGSLRNRAHFFMYGG